MRRLDLKTRWVRRVPSGCLAVFMLAQMLGPAFATAGENRRGGPRHHELTPPRSSFEVDLRRYHVVSRRPGFRARGGLVSDVDDTLLEHALALEQSQGVSGMVLRQKSSWLPDRQQLVHALYKHDIAWAIATSRRTKQAVLPFLHDSVAKLPVPDVLVSSVGTELHWLRHLHGKWKLELDHDYRAQQAAHFPRDTLTDRILALGRAGKIRGVELQPVVYQREYKTCFYVDADHTQQELEHVIGDALRRQGLPEVSVIYTTQEGTPLGHEAREQAVTAFLDVQPVVPGLGPVHKGAAAIHIARQLDLPLSRVMGIGNGGNDRHLVDGTRFPGTVVANHNADLNDLKRRGDPEQGPGTFFSEAKGPAAAIAGLQYFGILP